MAATPLPADAVVEPPGADVPPKMAAMSGVWNGAWLGPTGRARLCQTLVVERVHPLGFADIITSHGFSLDWGVADPGFNRVTARFSADGRLYFRNRFGRGFVVCVLEGNERLRASLQGQGYALLARVEMPPLQQDMSPSDAAPRPGMPRRVLTIEHLLATDPAPELVHFGHFGPIGPVAPALSALEGRLSVGPLHARRSVAGIQGAPLLLPAFAFDCATSGDEIIPVDQDIQALNTADRLNRIILSPGRIWSEPGEEPWSRALVPFVLTSDISNEAHNGVACFAFADGRLTNLRLQLAQETNPWRELDLAAHGPARFEPRPIARRAAILAARETERRLRWPLRPWRDLPRPAGPPGFDAGQPSGKVSASGLLLERELYLHACETRRGAFPMPAEMRFAAFSVTKSLAATVLFWLAAAHGGNIPDEPVVANLTPPRNAFPAWQRVTLRNLLDMASGLGTADPGAPYRPFVDEANRRVLAWSQARSAAAKLRAAFAFGPLPWGPGRVFRYNSALFFVLAAAMDATLKAREGPAANLWDRFTEDVLNPLGIVVLPMMHTVEPDGRRGIPLLSTGAYPTLEQAARIARLLLDEGRAGGRQLLDPTEIRRGLDWSGTPTSGLPTQPDLMAHNGTYASGIWRSPWRTRDGMLVTAVSMQGYGGNAVVLLPNEAVCLRFAAGQTYAVADMIRTAESVRGFAPETSGLRAPPPVSGTRLEGAALELTVLGNTLVSRAGDWVAYCGPDGRLYLGRDRQDPVVGRWSIEAGRILVQHDSTVAAMPSARWSVFTTPDAVLLINEDTGQLSEIGIEKGLAVDFHPTS